MTVGAILVAAAFAGFASCRHSDKRTDESTGAGGLVDDATGPSGHGGSAGNANGGSGGIAAGGGGMSGTAGAPGGFLAWASDASVWAPLSLPHDASTACSIWVADTAKLYPISSTWVPCGDGCSELALGEGLHPTRRVDQISLGSPSVAAGIMALTLVTDTDYEFGGPPATFEVSRWIDLRSLTVMAAVRGGIPKVQKCVTAFNHAYEDPRVTDVYDMNDSDVIYRLDPDTRTLGSTIPVSSMVGAQFMSIANAAILPIPGLSAIYFDAKTVVLIDAQASTVSGAGRNDLVVWRWGTAARGWKNDGKGARDWLSGLPGNDGVLSVAPGRIAGVSNIVEGARIWRTDVLDEGAAIIIGPVIVPFGVGKIYAIGDWAVFEGVASDGQFLGIVNLTTFKVWRMHPQTTDLDYNAGTYAVDEQYVYLGERERKEENRSARKIVRYELAKVPVIAELVPPVAP